MFDHLFRIFSLYMTSGSALRRVSGKRKAQEKHSRYTGIHHGTIHYA